MTCGHSDHGKPNGADDLITAVTENYERLSADLQADIPLKRVWALVVEE